MAVYNASGTQLSQVYSVNGTLLASAYDVYGNEVLHGSSPIQPMDWTNIPTQYRTNIASAMSYANTYLNSHSNAFMFPVLTDVHDKFYNEPNYMLYNYPYKFDKFLFLGDIANSYSQTQMNNAKAYMQQASTVNTLALIGNHELSNWAEGDDLPKVWYQPLIPSSAVVMSGTDALVYYFDDTANNVRWICMDSCTPIYKSAGSQLFTMAEIEFCASAMESAGSKDIIILNHAMGGGFYLVTDVEKTTWKSDTTVTNMTTFNNLMSAFVNRSTINITVDNVVHSHSFTSATNDLIGYITGHYHNAGFYDGLGYNKFTCPSSYYNSAGMSIFIVDPDAKKIIWLIAYKSLTSIGTYEYTYGS